MNHILLIFSLILFSETGFAQSQNQKVLLDKFIEAHNMATNEAIESFIKETYHPKVYGKIDLDKHVAFYNQIIEEFGPLNIYIYKVVEETESKLIVHLIKEDESLMNQNIDPKEVLVVELDLSDENPNYMSRGLGLGALVCEIRKD